MRIISELLPGKIICKDFQFQITCFFMIRPWNCERAVYSEHVVLGV